MNQAELLTQYTNAAKESTDRTRRILLIMVVASILVANACWNSRSGSWVNSRLAMARAVDDLLNPQNNKPPAGIPNATLEARSIGQQTLYGNAQGFINETGRTPNQAHQSLLWAQKVRTEQTSQVQVPVLGISFDVNDLGLLGGVTFIVLLIWVNYSLWHHSNNLKLAFDYARQLGSDDSDDDKPRVLYHTYQNLAMHQVLTIPPRPLSIKATNPGASKLWIRKLSKSLYALPFLVQSAVVAHDWYTSWIGKELNWAATWIVLIAGTVFLGFIAALTVTCFRRWKETFETWQTVANDI